FFLVHVGCGFWMLTVCRLILLFFFFFSSRRRHTRWPRDWSSDVCSSDLGGACSRHLRRCRPVSTRVAARGGGERAARAGEAAPGRREELAGGHETVHRGGARRSRQCGGRGRARLRAALASGRAQGPGLTRPAAPTR